MVAPSSLLGLYALFSSGPVGRQRYKPRQGGGGGGSGGRSGRGGAGRSAGRSGGRGGRGGNKKRGGDSRGDWSTQSRTDAPLPALTSATSPRPSYFTARHTYEDVLIEELHRHLGCTLGGKEVIDKMSILSPHPGLVCLEDAEIDVTQVLPGSDDLTYALQSIPDCVVVKAESIKGLATAIIDALLDQDDERAATIQAQLWSAPRGSLSVHSLVPQMGRGVPEPQMMRRSSKVAEEVAAQMKKICPAARPAREEEEENSDDIDQQKWLLQILLLEPEVAAASLTQCTTSAQTLPCLWTWPNWSLPAGLAKVDIEQVMPSSAYRKLLESFWYMGDRPPVDGPRVPPVVDLGASPGGWTGALRLMGCRVLSVDRSPLDDTLMNDELVEFVEGDAFKFIPPWIEEYSATLDAPPDNSWMVSDIIAYPERVVELLEDWCGKRWVSRVVITCKFQGKEVPWAELQRAEAAAQGHGYACKTKHFFNNKNEVTLMAIDENCTSEAAVKDPLMGVPMYPAAMIGGKIAKSKKK